jgi:pentatricopeptide repeat protein
MIRYLSIVDDMKGVAIPLNSAEWTSAISFVARYVNWSTEVEVEAALQMWREMEHSAGVKAADATFNVLYDVACKAGKFVLAEMIYKEMDARGLKWTIYHYVSRIHGYGLKGDGDGARAAYKELVEAGEMVDTIVLNAMISALIHCHEANAAEYVYERMKRMYMEDTGRTRKLRSRDFKKNRAITRTLMKMATIAKNHPEERENLQKQVIIAPDVQTYRILITYFAVRTGELDKAAKFLDEMKYFDIPVHGALFNALFKGFAIHGGIRYTQWSEDRLERVWSSFVQALDDEVETLYISRWIVIWVLKAFAKCSGKARTVEVWEQIKERYEPGAMELDHIMQTLRTILEGRDMAEERHDWLLGSKV